MMTAKIAVDRLTDPAALPLLPLAAALERRGLAAPALLYLAGHRPLAFAAGQLLALVAPLAAALGLNGTMKWAHLLSAPEGVDHLQAALATRSSGLQPDMAPNTRRSGLQPDTAGARGEGSCRAASPTYEGHGYEGHGEGGGR